MYVLGDPFQLLYNKVHSTHYIVAERGLKDTPTPTLTIHCLRLRLVAGHATEHSIKPWIQNSEWLAEISRAASRLLVDLEEQ